MIPINVGYLVIPEVVIPPISGGSACVYITSRWFAGNATNMWESQDNGATWIPIGLLPNNEKILNACSFMDTFATAATTYEPNCSLNGDDSTGWRSYTPVPPDNVIIDMTGDNSQAVLSLYITANNTLKGMDYNNQGMYWIADQGVSPGGTMERLTCAAPSDMMMGGTAYVHVLTTDGIYSTASPNDNRNPATWSWTKTGSLPPSISSADIIAFKGMIVGSSTTKLYIATATKLFLSLDKGATWTVLNYPCANVVSASAGGGRSWNSNTILVTDGTNLYTSSDDGANWTTLTTLILG